MYFIHNKYAELNSLFLSITISSISLVRWGQTEADNNLDLVTGKEFTSINNLD